MSVINIFTEDSYKARRIRDFVKNYGKQDKFDWYTYSYQYSYELDIGNGLNVFKLIKNKDTNFNILLKNNDILIARWEVRKGNRISFTDNHNRNRKLVREYYEYFRMFSPEWKDV